LLAKTPGRARQNTIKDKKMIRYNILEITNDEVGVMISEITSGVLKEDSEITFTEYKSELWDRIDEELSTLEIGEELKIVADLSEN
jgi:hypothetical protein